MPDTSTGPEPLSSLLSRGWIAFVIEADNAFEAAGMGLVRRPFRISLPMWANGLRVVDDDGIAVDELLVRAGAVCNLGGLERWGWLRLGDRVRGTAGFGTRRGIGPGTLVRPTRAGTFARRVWPEIAAETEARWRARFGNAQIDALAHLLVGLATEMPWSPPEVHPSDGFFTHVALGSGPETERPFVALLGQVLTRVTVDHERDSPVSLPLAANVLRVLEGGPRRVRELPLLSGVSKEAIAMAVGFLQRRRLAAVDDDRRLWLTAAGVEAFEEHRRRTSPPPLEALRPALRGILDQRDALSEGLVPPKGCWRGERPWLTWTQRVLADPLGCLPWQPMVLHRGGWPDGS